ncbi:hypothetical protein M408DRAFT_61483 [Serendipita vermifera MAFF 305830]|uniref:Uncharacterized protein n=1 Tax=Serendipita vermifera MAFF 305830 TaxID=933852 RepID=A0A0C3BA18_SERVB|nr:hypothetical protein M408DRAFT_61483 [Serendipita vermifera MAFF 305830]
MPINIECDSHVAECMEGTRENILNEIYSWMENVDAPNILWLKGYPGVGKSAIASSVVEHLRSLKRLGSSFFFRREMANDMTPNALWRVVAHDLARRFRPIKEEMIARLKAEEIIPTTVNVDKLFRQLIRDPLTAIEETLTGALPVIVIDALDECGGLDAQHSEQRRNLLQTLKGWSRLPTKFKLFVTSRNESDIDQLFSTTNHHLIEVFAGKSVEAKSSQDITTFLKDRFQKIAMKYPRSLPLDWPGHQVVLELTTMAQGLFIWVKVITNFAGRGDPKEQLSLILRGNSASDMTKLYSLILDTSFPEQTENFIKCFRSILGAVILGKASLPTSSLLHLLSLTDTTMEHICNGLQAVMDSRDTLRIHHQSFVDFLMDQSRCPTSFLIDRKRESQTLTVACLRTMEDHLRFNICNFETSYLRNAGIQNLAARVEECIPHHLSYSSCFWASHLAEIPFEREVMGYLEIFMAKQFLYWLEVLSGMKRVNIASGMLWILINYLQDGGQSDAMAKDMQKFVSTFGSVISRSLPHIYLSALTFAPKNSAVSQKYIKDYPRMLAIQSGGQSEWPAIQNILVDHDDQVRSVSFSPDSRRIVSGSDDRTIRVWDAETGDIVAGPFEGHVEAVNSVAFSPNGSRIVSGSEDGTIRLWDAETGELVTGSFEGHNKAINSVAFSPDGTWVVSGSSDTTIRVWEAKTGQAVTGPLKGHSKIVKSVAFSPNSRRIVSGSYDRTIRVWDAETGQVVTGPLKGHRKTVNSVAFSLDGRRIVSGSLDRTIRVWDAETGKLVVGPFKAHRSAVKSVAFSPDGRRIVSGSYDQSVRLWDAETGRMITQPLKGHDEAVLSVAFSPDGRRIVSGSEDSTIRLWDAETSNVDMVPLKGHHKTVNSVAFSPDGGRIVSCSMDSTIRVWDSETGEVVAGPMEEDSSVNSVSFSPHGNRIVTGTNDGIIRVWDAKTGEVATESLEEDGSAVYSVAFSPDGKRVVSGSDCGIIRVWDAETGELVVGPMEEDSPVNSVSFSPNGRSIVSGSEDSTTRLWDAETGKVILGPLKGHGGAVNSVDISPDGRWIASGSGDHTIRLWDSETGQMVVSPLKGHQGSVQSVAFSPNGRQIASSSFDYTIRLWDAETGQVILGPLKGHHSGIMSVAFSADSRRIVSGSYDCTIRVWDIETGQNLICTTPIFGDSSRMDEIDGWVCGADYELLFWIPPDLRLGLYRPSNTLVIGPIVKTVLDFTNFVHGESWVHCRDKISL